MSDSDTLSDSSGELPSALIASQRGTVNSRRYELAYPRQYLLSLSKSPKVRSPTGMKPLSEWYGEYEIPSQHINANGGAAGGAVQGNGRYNNRGGGTGVGPLGEGAHGHRTRGGQHQQGEHQTGGGRDRTERGTDSSRAAGAERSSSASGTGSMGDFRLAGAKPFNAATFGTGMKEEPASRRMNGARNAGGQQLKEDDSGLPGSWGGVSPRDGSAFSAAMADRKRLNTDFTKKDGRAEEGGWRSSKEASGSYRDKDRRTGNAGGSLANGNGERGGRRQPAWMDDDPSIVSSNSGGRRSDGLPARPSHDREDALPEWAASDGLSDALEGGLESSASAAAPVVQHVDQLQAWKAEMKAIEAKKKAEDEKALRREMGLPDLPTPPPSSAATAPQMEAAAPAAKPAPTSVFADFLLPKDKERKEQGQTVGSSDRIETSSAGASAGAAGKGRASRFARFFDPAGNATSQSASSAGPAQQIASPEPSQARAQPSQAENPLAALLGMGASAAQTSGSSPQPQNPADAQSMMRLMQMLQVSSGQTQQDPPQPSGPSQQQSSDQSRPQGAGEQHGPSPSSRLHSDAQNGASRSISQGRPQQSRGDAASEQPPLQHAPTTTNADSASLYQQLMSGQPSRAGVLSPPMSQQPPPLPQYHQQTAQQSLPPRHQNHAQGPRSPSGPVDYASGNVAPSSRLANRLSGTFSPQQALQQQQTQQQQQQQASTASSNALAWQQLLQAQAQIEAQKQARAQAHQQTAPAGSRRGFAQQTPQEQASPSPHNGMTSPPAAGLPPHLQQAMQASLANGMQRGTSPTLLQHQQAQKAAYLAAQLGHQQQPQPPMPGQARVPSQQQQQQFAHARSPSSQMAGFDPRQLLQHQTPTASSEAALARLFADRAAASSGGGGLAGFLNNPGPPPAQQQHALNQQQYPYGLPPHMLSPQALHGQSHPPFPPPPHQQQSGSQGVNPLAHLLNAGNAGNAGALGHGHPSHPQHQFHQIQQPMSQHQNHFTPPPQPMSSNQIQQNQIDLMALLTGARR